jgi:sulfite reductase beta subunit-like hemoprotein
VFVDKFGIDELRRQVEEELDGDWVAERDFIPDPLLFVDDEEAAAPPVRPTYASPNGDRSEFDRWTEPTSSPSDRRGSTPSRCTSSAATSRPPAARLRGHRAGVLRRLHPTTVGQNLVFRWVRDEALYDVWRSLVRLGLGEHGAQQVNDVVSCPGRTAASSGSRAPWA